MVLIGHVIRYHRKARPKKKHGQFRQLSEHQQRVVWVLAGLLRIAVNLNRTKDQQIQTLSCNISDEAIEISVTGQGSLDVGIWASMGERHILEKALERTVEITAKT